MMRRHNRSNCSRRGPRLLKGRHEGRPHDWAARSEKFKHSKQIKQKKKKANELKLQLQIEESANKLYVAIVKGDYFEVRFLVGRGACIWSTDSKDQSGLGALELACVTAKSSAEIVRFLIERCDKNQLDCTSLLRFTLCRSKFDRCAMVNLEVIRCLLDKGADPNELATKETMGTCKNGENAFHLACERADGLEAVLLLLERGADPRKMTGYDSLTPLDIANGYGCRDISRVLRIVTDRLLIGITMLQELFVYHQLDCSSIIDICEMIYGGAADPDRRSSAWSRDARIYHLGRVARNRNIALNTTINISELFKEKPTLLDRLGGFNHLLSTRREKKFNYYS